MRRSLLLALSRASAGANCVAQPSAAANSARALLGAISSGAPPAATAAAAVASLRHVSSSTGASAAAQAAVSPVQVDGNLEALVAQLDTVVSSDSVTPKDLADAALALTYLQAKGNRRIWGKILEKANLHKSAFDAASLSSLLWAVTASNVSHFKTTYELAAPVAGLLNSATPAQLSFIVEGLGRAGVNDVELYNAVTGKVAPRAGDYKPAELARILWGYAAAGHEDLKLLKAALKEVTGKADAAGARELIQTIWSLAKLRRQDKPALDGLAKALRGKADGPTAPQDVAALAWSLGYLNYQGAGDLPARAVAAVKGSLGDLTTEQAIELAWGLGVLGQGDKATTSALFGQIAKAVDAAPDAIDVAALARLHEASALVGGGQLPDRAAGYARSVYGLVQEHAKQRRPKAQADFVADVAEHVARALGARYKPEIEKAVAGLSRKTPDGVYIDIAADLDKDIKVAVEPLGPSDLTSNTQQPLGTVTARGKVLEAAGYKLVAVPHPEWAGLKDTKAKAQYILSAIRAAVPSASSKVNALAKKLEEPFDPYSE